MGSAVSSPMGLAWLIVPLVFTLGQSQLAKRQAKALDQLKDKAPHILKPPKTPKQLAHEAYAKKRKILLTLCIAPIILSSAILTQAAPQYMGWSLFFDTEQNTELFDTMREVGLGMIGLAALIVCAYHVGYVARISYVARYWNVPHDIDVTPTGLSFLYAQRDEESDLESLNAGIFCFVRDPETFANQLFFLALALSTFSWLLSLYSTIITLLCEPIVVERDMVWVQLYGPIYDKYRANRGGQFWCTCLNGPEARFESVMRKTQQELAEITTIQ